MQHFCNYPPLSVVLYLGCSRNNTVNITQFCVLCFITHCLKLWEFGISSEFPYGVLHVWLPVPSVHERLSLTALLSTRPRLIIIIIKNKHVSQTAAELPPHPQLCLCISSLTSKRITERDFFFRFYKVRMR